MYNPGLVKLSFSLDVAGFSRAFSMVESPALRRAMHDLEATGVYTATYDGFGFRRVDAELTADCAVRVMFLGDSFTDGVFVDDRETAVNRTATLPVNAAISPPARLTPALTDTDRLKNRSCSRTTTKPPAGPAWPSSCTFPTT